ncbi:MAG: formylglycine-generating enzyme family protein [Planctomycetes bacterium]|nr:formylglycine-generating enzyme family protein [Planctomycetota bacterium]
MGLVTALWLLIPGSAAKAQSVPDAEATSESEMKPYKEVISGTDVTFDMVPIKGGILVMGSPDSAPSHKDDETPQIKVRIEPFWMGKCEVTWDEYDIWSFGLDIQRRKLLKIAPTERDKLADAITRPTKPYTDMTFGMGHDGYPAVCMTQLAAKMYCKWLSAKTGRYYRLPTEAEWEWACRAGTDTAYSFGDDPADLDQYGWYFDNSEDKYHPVGKKKPNPWGLYDMHGNVSEWVLDQYDPEHYKKFADGKVHTIYEVLNVPKTLYPRVVRGGSWDDDPEGCRSAARHHSTPEWKMQDPQIPQSIWYHTDAWHVGFRVVRPLNPPSEEIREKYELDAPDDVKNED